MKLLRCHIENFGVLSNFDFDFSSGLTVIYRENGFGKSTFAAFIKAMFYGMPRGGSRSVVENERKRYDPWQGGKYGGFLEFEYQETRYRVTRYFGKTASKDTFQIMDISNRQNITPFSERLGEELFQLDAESFSRSTYMPQLMVFASDTMGFSSKSTIRPSSFSFTQPNLVISVPSSTFLQTTVISAFFSIWYSSTLL